MYSLQKCGHGGTNRAAAVSRDAEDITQDIPVLGIIVLTFNKFYH